MRLCIGLALCGIGALVACAPAFAAPVAGTRPGEHDRLVSMPVLQSPTAPPSGWPALVREARKYLGTNPTDRKSLWCATFMNFVLAKAGYVGTHSDAARSFAEYGHRISSPKVGAIAVLARGESHGHVGVVSGVDPNGNPIIISGNHGHRVGIGIYPRSRVIAYVMPVPGAAAPRAAVPAVPVHSSPAHLAPAIDFPIAELIAAIRADQSRAAPPPPPSKPQSPAKASVRAPQTRQGPVPVQPHQVVEQTASWRAGLTPPNGMRAPVHAMSPDSRPRRIAAVDAAFTRR